MGNVSSSASNRKDSQPKHIEIKDLNKYLTPSADAQQADVVISEEAKIEMKPEDIIDEAKIENKPEDIISLDKEKIQLDSSISHDNTKSKMMAGNDKIDQLILGGILDADREHMRKLVEYSNKNAQDRVRQSYLRYEREKDKMIIPVVLYKTQEGKLKVALTQKNVIQHEPIRKWSKSRNPMYGCHVPANSKNAFYNYVAMAGTGPHKFSVKLGRATGTKLGDDPGLVHNIRAKEADLEFQRKYFNNQLGSLSAAQMQESAILSKRGAFLPDPLGLLLYKTSDNRVQVDFMNGDPRKDILKELKEGDKQSAIPILECNILNPAVHENYLTHIHQEQLRRTSASTNTTGGGGGKSSIEDDDFDVNGEESETEIEYDPADVMNEDGDYNDASLMSWGSKCGNFHSISGLLVILRDVLIVIAIVYFMIYLRKKWKNNSLL